MTGISGSITIEGGKLERAIADLVDTRVQAAVRPVLDEVRRLAALAEAQMVGSAEAAKILVSAGATLDIQAAQGIVESLARIGYRLTLVDPEAVTQELPQVKPRDREAELRADLDKHVDQSWASQFE